MKQAKLKTLTFPLLALVLTGSSANARAQSSEPAQTAVGSTAPDRRPAAPQVVTVVHRLNGIKVLRMLLRSGEVGAVDTVDEAFRMSSEVHTNIIAGLALEDGETIAAWLPEAEVEVDAWGSFAPPGMASSLPRPGAPVIAATPGSVQVTADLTVTPELTIIGRDGKRRPAQYIGLDGITGLSLLRLSEKSSPVVAGIHEATVTLKQHIRLFSPEPAPNRTSTTRTISVRIGETAGTIVSVKRGLDGKISRIKMESGKLSAANVGGIAVNDAGQTIGIVTSVEKNEAVILPPALIRAASSRVLARRGSVPRPWLGVSGESVAFTPLAGIVQRGWEPERALSLIKNQNGILLTSITPGSPAEIAALRAGDVIVQVNNSVVKNTEDFSVLLETAGEQPVSFTIVRPDHPEPELVTVKLSEMFGPSFKAFRWPDVGPRGFAINPLISQGIEAMPLGSAAAARLNSSGGLLVIYVQSQTPASRAGLRPTDVIEAINGQPILRTSAEQFRVITAARFTLSVVREKQKVEVPVEVPSP